MKFLHAADIHIGYRQYNSEQRFKDFGQAFQKVAQCAIDEDVDVCLIAGDLFHKSNIKADTLLQAIDALERLRQKHIKVIAISGNHDRYRFGDRKTWLDFLDAQGNLYLLESFTGGQYVVEGESYIDIDGVRFLGMPWYGGSTRKVLKRIIDELPEQDWSNIRYTVMLAHTAIEGQMLNMPDMLRFEDVEPLRTYVDYFALGHLHKPYSVPKENPWIYNPGAIENNSFDEAKFDQKGAYVVTVDESGNATVEMRVIHGRPFRTIRLSVTPHTNYQSLIDALRDELAAKQQQWNDIQPPVVNLVLGGDLKFDRNRLDMDALRQLIEETMDCLIVRVNPRFDMLEFAGDYDDELDINQLEQLAFADVAREKGYGTHADSWGSFLQSTKNKALSGESPEQIYNSLTDYMATLNEEGDE